MRNIILKIAYDGTLYHGWQNSQNVDTIEGTLLKILEKILKEKPYLQAASRTDAGVHAKGQIVNFLSATKIPCDGIKMQLNNCLPKDISVLHVYEETPNFHPTLDCTLKEYHYFVCNSQVQLPHHRLYSLHFPYALDFSVMEEAAKAFCGHHNFEAFCNAKKRQTYPHYRREVTSIEIVRLADERICFKVKGKQFLYKMVRNLVGTLLYIGCKKLTLQEINETLLNKNRFKLGVTAKAHGLHLHKIFY